MFLLLIYLSPSTLVPKFKLFDAFSACFNLLSRSLYAFLFCVLFLYLAFNPNLILLPQFLFVFVFFLTRSEFTSTFLLFPSTFLPILTFLLVFFNVGLFSFNLECFAPHFLLIFLLVCSSSSVWFLICICLSSAPDNAPVLTSSASVLICIWCWANLHLFFSLICCLSLSVPACFSLSVIVAFFFCLHCYCSYPTLFLFLYVFISYLLSLCISIQS